MSGDNDAIQRVLKGDLSSFRVLVERYQGPLFCLLRNILPDVSECEDVAQETFLRAYQKFSSLREAGSFRAWTNRIAFRLALNRQREIRRRLVRDDSWHAAGTAETANESQGAEQQFLLARLRHEIAMLPEKLRQVLQLSIVEDMDAADVALVLGIPPGTVRSRLHAARKLLLEAMK